MPTAKHNDSAQAPSSSSVPRRIRRGLLWVFIVASCALASLAVGVTFWLAGEGIQLGSVSGISLSKQGISVKKLSLNIKDNEFVLNNVLLLHRYAGEQQPTLKDAPQEASAAGWRVEADRLAVTIPPALRKTLLENGFIADSVTFDKVKLITQGALTEGQFVITADLANAILATPSSKTTYPQSLHNISIGVSTTPKLQLSGTIGRGEIQPPLAALMTKSYPVTFNGLSFALPAQEESLPLSLTIEHIALANTLSEQSDPNGIQQLSLAVDLLSPQHSLALSINTFRWDPTAFLSQEQSSASVNFPHLGHITSLLFQAPVQQIEITSMTITDYLSQASLVFQRNTKHTRFELKGKVISAQQTLLPLDSYFQADENQQAVFSVKLTDAEQTSASASDLVTCHARWQFTSDLPQSLNCKSDNVTKVLDYFAIQSISLLDPNQQQASIQVNRVEPQPLQTEIDRPGSMSVAAPQSATWDYAIEIISPSRIQFRLPRSHQRSGLNLDGPVTLKQDGRWTGLLSFDRQQAQMKLSSPEDLDIETENPALQGRFSIHTFSCALPLVATVQHTAAARPQCSGTSTITGIAPLIELSSLTISEMQLKQQIALQSSGHGLKLHLRETQLLAKTIVLPDVSDHKQSTLRQVRVDIPDIRLQLNNLFSSSPANTPEIWLHHAGKKPATLEAAFSSLRTMNAGSEPGKQQAALPSQQFYGHVAITLDQFKADNHAQTWSLSSDYSTRLALNLNNQTLPVIRNQGKLTLNSDALAITGLLSTAQSQPWLDFSFTQQWKSHISRIQIAQKPISFSAKQSLQKYYLAPLPVRADLHHGSVSARADLKYKNDLWSGTLDIFTTHLSGHIKDTHFADLNVSFTSLLTNNTIRSRQPLTVHAGWLHFGTLFQDIIASLDFDTGKSHYMLHKANANLLGGQISTRNVVSDSLTNIDVIPLRIQRLNLKKLLDLFNPKDVELTGTLDGVLPVRIVDKNPVIEKGALFSRSPGGFLKYKEGANINENVRSGGENSLKVITRILRNYKYDSLAVDIDYSKEGQLNASARFKGRNPDFQNGRPVNINLNLEDDIPALIKTLNTINASQFERIFVKQLGLEN
ncbi:YdbH domain-containing protein [Photobacterium halotolerans]|uniref:Uncharacterized protein n=1 Tax=Photobacterium halotolerans TaxID=265726 RepID=A0A0F5VBV3_9GAMM|nr:YdbH domain-containing protein [Photobacterium halotolerans]KKC99645.1 hypothetical protein KY46_12065 [Photobacterium halotolerans]